jgi:hypothetical protein
LVDDSPVNLLVIAEQATLDDIANAASSRGRASNPLSDADVDLSRLCQTGPLPLGLCARHV